MNISRAPSKCAGGPDLPKVPSAELDEQFAVLPHEQLVEEAFFFLFSDTRASGLRSKPRVGFRGGRMFRLRPQAGTPRPASPRTPPDIPPPRVSTGGHPNPPNPRSARPGGRAHRLGGRGRRLGGREHAHRRGRRRSRRIGLPRASRQARFMAVKKEPLRSGGRIGRRCMPGGWGGAGEAGGGLGGAQFSSCPGNGTSNPGTDLPAPRPGPGRAPGSPRPAAQATRPSRIAPV